MSLAHKIFLKLPRPLKIGITMYKEYKWRKKSYKILTKIEREHFEKLKQYVPMYVNNRKYRILFYHINGLSFGGTEKFLQIIAKHLPNEKYEIWFMTGPQEKNSSRRNYIASSHIHFIDFIYSNIENKLPYIIHESTPNIAQTITENKIDLIITATPGHTMFPINLITTVPIININIFGSFTVQENIKKIIGLSHEVIDRSCLVAKRNKHEVMYIPSERPPQIPELAQKVRSKFNISATDFVFGRIGRPVDDIFDPIALNAFAFLQKTYPEVAKYCHYIIMAPSLRMKEKVIGENIKNVHFLDPSPNEHDVFAFHQSINCLAHARLDGETCGLNITESMLCGNPILTHTSHIWNAHLEYLLPTFSRVAKKDDYQSYAQHMKEFYSIFKSDINKWKEMRQASKKQAEKLFLIESNIDRFEKYIKESCH